jgi:hypothetical protein
MYWLVEGDIALAQHLSGASDYGRCFANHERVAVEHIDGRNIDKRRGGEARSRALCARYPVRRG